MQANITSRYSSGRSIELIASGIPSLDTVLGGGLPLGSIVLLTEDELGIYSDMFLKTYLAQGLVHGDAVFLATPDSNVKTFFESLPAPMESHADEPTVKNTGEPMTIAWRYGNSNSLRDNSKQLSLSNNFTFGKRISPELLNDENIHKFSTSDSEIKDVLETLLQDIQSLARDHNSKVQKSAKRQHLRICLHHLGSFLWCAVQEAIPKFLFKLRCIVAQYPASVIVTLPAMVFHDRKIVSRCCQVSDVVFGLVAIDPTSNPLYSEYTGLFQLHKISPVNSMTPLAEVSDDWAFKLIKKRLLIERLTLPPELDTSTQREQVKDIPSCGSLKKTLDF
uniref:Elongator complex protein 4 n=1 Tax=Lygus hesperus TaxID=30085 RepID=A0A146LQU5_LYGHE